MCGILYCGPYESFSKEIIEDCLKMLQSRGPDYINIKMNRQQGFWYIITQLMVVGEDCFPINHENYELSGNIEIYNYKWIYDEVLENKFPWNSKYSDARIIIPLYLDYLKKEKNDIKAFKSTLDIIREDYAFIMHNSEGVLFVARDPIGIRPLYYALSNNGEWAFCSMVDPLIKLGFRPNEINTVQPGNYLVTNLEKISEGMNWETILEIKNMKNILRKFSGKKIHEQEFFTKSMQLKDLLIKSIEKRIPDKKFSLFLSGGIDSSLILKLIINLVGKERINVICVGFPESSDLKAAVKLCSYFRINPHIVELDKELIINSLSKVKKILLKRNKVIFGEKFISPIEISIALPFYLASQYSHSIGDKVALSGQGADELFIGYKKYYVKPYDINYEELYNFLMRDLMLIARQNLERDDLISMSNSIEMRYPYLDLDLINWVLRNDLCLFYSKNGIRKQILRTIAAEIGLPDYIIQRRKKAAQYGTNIMKCLKQESKSFKSLTDYINSI